MCSIYVAIDTNRHIVYIISVDREHKERNNNGVRHQEDRAVLDSLCL